MTKHLQDTTASNDIVVQGRIYAFLSGQTDGQEVFSALYGSVADEPVPARLRALMGQVSLEKAA
jgi:hypothetical protein